MGSFEKLGILVIVVIIVMILAVAIYQWGGAGVPPTVNLTRAGAPPLVVNNKKAPEVNFIDQEEERTAAAAEEQSPPGADSDSWPGGIPREYVIQRGDSMWVLVVKRWKLKESFVDAIARANPKLNMKRLRVGKTVRIPNPEAYRPGRKSAPSGLRTYEVQVGDLLETIARNHLGSRNRWQEILEVNPGLNPKRLRPGQRINLPAR
ncbi:MAG: LysM peptidoglycan-binding domain-containing protein [Planctomycetota bacterium]|jgi:nucleoid-associated protein YgaU